jgi:uncharacterized protein
MKPLCIFHSPCLDGFTAAWAMWLKHPDAEFVPGVYGQPPPDCTGRDVYLLDFSYKRDVMEKIALEARRLVILDHHRSAQADLDGFAELFTPDQLVDVALRFDMKKSGTRLAWEWFHPNKIAPRLVAYVEDRDLWRFALPDSKAINATLFSYDYDFEVWSRLSEEMETSSINGPVGLDRFITEGRAIERKHQKDVKELVGRLSGRLRFTKLAIAGVWGLTVPAVNLPYTYASDAGNLLARGAPFAAVYCQNAKGEYEVSLRSIEGGMDVSEVAAQYGGGGHKHAAGFRIKALEEL